MSSESPRKYPLGPYGLTAILFTLFIVSWAAQTYSGWQEFQADQKDHGQAAMIFGSEGYVWHWLSQTMENWQSEFLQLLTFVVLTAHFVHIGSHESKDNDDKMQDQLNRMEEKLSRIEETTKSGQKPKGGKDGNDAPVAA